MLKFKTEKAGTQLCTHNSGGWRRAEFKAAEIMSQKGGVGVNKIIEKK